MRWRPYPKYQESGVEWLGKAPDGWLRKRLRFVAKFNPSKSEISSLPRDTEVSFLPMEAIGNDGSTNLDRTRPIGEVENGFTYFRDDDVTLAKITPCFENGKGALMHGLTNGIGFGTTELIVLRPGSSTSGAFLQWLFCSAPFRKLGEAEMYGAGGQKRVPDSYVKNFDFAWPSFDEQTAISAFLGRETSKLDTLVAKQLQLIEILQKKRQALIFHAVTKSLNPDAPMRNSEVEWLGEVPEHWKIYRNKVMFREIDERSDTDGGELLTVSHLTGVTPRSEKNVNMFLAETLEGYKKCAAGDLAINTMWAWMGALGISAVSGLVSPSYNVYRVRNQNLLDPSYYDYMCRISEHVVAIKANSTGVWESRLRLYPDAFLSMRMCLPPIEEQRQIVEYLNGQLKKLKTLIVKAEQSIALMREHRTALISAAVTGKIDVRCTM